MVALALMGGAYALSGPIPFIDTVTAESSEALLRAYAAKDSDADGLQDWQETLYGTDPENPTSFRADLKDGEAANQGLLTPRSFESTNETSTDFPSAAAAPSSLTERFAQKFLAQYLTTRGANPPTEEEMLSFIKEAVAELQATRAATTAFTSSEVMISNSTLESYASAAERAMRQNAVPADKTDLDYFALALEKDDAASLAKLKSISGGYAAVAAGLMEVNVPQDAAAAHLGLCNALMRMSVATDDLAALTDDPIRALLGIGGYQQYEAELANAYARMHEVLAAGGAVIPEGTEGYAFMKAAEGAARVLSQPAP